MSRKRFLIVMSSIVFCTCGLYILFVPSVPNNSPEDSVGDTASRESKTSAEPDVSDESLVEPPGSSDSVAAGPLATTRRTKPDSQVDLTQSLESQFQVIVPPPDPVATIKIGTPQPPLPEMKGSSWQNPFEEQYWTSHGWTFAKSGMTSTGHAESSATFRRTYEKLMLECDITPREDPAGTCELHLTTNTARSRMRFVIDAQQMQIVAFENGMQTVIKKQALASPMINGKAQHFRLVATGNRIVISWNGKKFLTADQIASQSGRPVLWSIHTSDAFEISRLRVEGD